MEKKTTIFNHSLTWGAILGIVLIVYSLLLYFLDLWMNQALGFVSWLFLIVGVFYAMKVYRDNVNNGILSYGNAFLIGLFVCLIASFVSSVYTFVHFSYIAPEVIDKMVQMSEEKLLSKGLSEEMVEQSMAMSKKFMSPVLMAIWGFVAFAVIGSILSLIIAAVAKKEPNPSQV